MEDVPVKKQSRLKIVAASVFFVGWYGVFGWSAMTRNTSMRHFTPAALVAEANSVDNQLVQVDGLIAEGQLPSGDAANF